MCSEGVGGRGEGVCVVWGEERKVPVCVRGAVMPVHTCGFLHILPSTHAIVCTYM